VGPDFVRPDTPKVNRYTRTTVPTQTISADGQVQHFENGAQLVANWWKLFNSTQLDVVVKEGLNNNPGVQAAQASLRQSMESLQAGYGIFYPQVSMDFNATRQEFSPARFGSSSSSSIFNLVTLSASVSYALDIFGGERRAIEGLQSQVDLQRATVQATYLALSGNIVNTVIARAAYREEISVTEQMIALQQEQILIAQKQVQAGTIPYANVLVLKGQLTALEATLPALRQKLAQTEHLLATLSGRFSAQWTPPQVDLADIVLPQNLPVSLPSALVRQRPDILAAEASLHGASANIGVATAALFPSFTLNGSFGQNNSAMNNLFQRNASFWSLGPDVSMPLFNGGTLLSERAAARAGYQQALANYRQTVLSAFAQVADALRGLAHDAEVLQAESQSLETAKESLGLTQTNYRAGLVNYPQILIATVQYQQAKLNFLQAQAQRLQDTTAIFVALGGGWWNPVPSPENGG
jgi:NodT family efflux transporter outer membrane factor (OMF) lipoprotein